MIRRPPRSTLSSSSAASDVYKRQTQSTWDYKFRSRLHAKKEKLFEIGDPNKWEIGRSYQLSSSIKSNKKQAFSIMCTKETEKENELKEFYAFIITQLRDQINVQFDFGFKDFKQNYKEYAQAHSNFSKNLINLFGEYEELFKVNNLMINKSHNCEILVRNVIDDYDKKQMQSKKG
eukprot:TRINITY_DN18460_c0_g1_i3.p1 TRINITY_DN18460_c0_g1~~TRINITY_DN18460_c0_g1_i3.p1  ORF type:complete len:176 (-),score=40.73 TRINITY_DN18460_c0_g1_i3:8-535(-)